MRMVIFMRSFQGIKLKTKVKNFAKEKFVRIEMKADIAI